MGLGNPNMDDAEFRSLVSLLDDSDPEVFTHVWEKLSSLGKEGLNRLEAEWEKREDPAIQSKIEELIQEINHNSITAEILEWRKSGGNDLLEGWMLISRFQYPGIDEAHYRNEISRLVNKTWLQASKGLDITGKLRVLNHILFAVENYRPERKQMRNPKFGFLNTLIDTKKGSPLSLGLLYLIICQKLEFPVGGVILPGYFILYLNEGNKEFYIDVFNGGIFFTRDDLKRHLKQFGVDEKPAFFRPTSNIYILLELLRGLADGYKAEGNEEKAAEIEQLLKDIDIHF